MDVRTSKAADIFRSVRGIFISGKRVAAVLFYFIFLVFVSFIFELVSLTSFSTNAAHLLLININTSQRRHVQKNSYKFTPATICARIVCDNRSYLPHENRRPVSSDLRFVIPQRVKWRRKKKKKKERKRRYEFHRQPRYINLA